MDSRMENGDEFDWKNIKRGNRWIVDLTVPFAFTNCMPDSGFDSLKSWAENTDLCVSDMEIWGSNRSIFPGSLFQLVGCDAIPSFPFESQKYE